MDKEIKFGESNTWAQGGTILGTQEVFYGENKLKYAELFTITPWNVFEPIKEWLFIHLRRWRADDFYKQPVTDISEDSWLTVQVRITDEFSYEDAVKFYLEHEKEILFINKEQ